MTAGLDGTVRAFWLLPVGLSITSLALAVYRLWVWRPANAPPGVGASFRGLNPQPAVTLLKPLCGLEPELLEGLRSFCAQDYPEFQIIFGARSPEDPALEVARRLAAEFSQRDIQIVSDAPVLGPNLKVANLAHMLDAARYDRLVIADSDMRVSPDYLRRIVPHFADPNVGIVTCLYKARATRSFWSRLEALYINEWFLPSVLEARALGSTAYGFGSTIGIRRDLLDSIGGFEALADYLADDYRLGELTRERGFRTVLSDYLVETLVHEPDLRSLLRHQLRWNRTIRTVRPWGHAFSFLTYAIPMVLIAGLLTSAWSWAAALLLVALTLRYLLHYTARRRLGIGRTPLLSTAWMIPLCDFLAFGVWVGSFMNRRVDWRQRHLSVTLDGRMGIEREPEP